MCAAFAASYTAESVNYHATTVPRAVPERLFYRKNVEWEGLLAVVAPMGCGKSTAAMEFGGYDVDALLADTPDRTDDIEWDERLIALGFNKQNSYDLDLANDIYQLRLERVFNSLHPDSNAPILYIHSTEMAHKLGVKIVAQYCLSDAGIMETGRYRSMAPQEQEQFLASAAAARSANDTYSRRHGIDLPVVLERVSQVSSLIWSVIHQEPSINIRRSFTREVLAGGDYLQVAKSGLQKMEDMILSDSNSEHEKAILARYIYSQLGLESPDYVLRHHNHPLWCDWLHKTVTVKWRENLQLVASNLHEMEVDSDETTLREKFPFSAGTSKFALCNLGDFIQNSVNSMVISDWSTQMLFTLGAGDVTVCSYERLLSQMVYDYMVRDTFPHLHKRATKVMLGLLPTREYTLRAAEAHNLIRVSGTLFGYKFHPREIGVVTYWQSLAGRSPDEVDIEKEAAERAQMTAPKYWYDPNTGTWSETEFDQRLRRAISSVYQETMQANRDKILALAEYGANFDEFLRMRKMWGKSGSATGAPKTTITLQAASEHAAEIEAVTTDVFIGIDKVLGRLRIRLNKAAVFEFSDFTRIAKEALADYMPNSFTRFFTKKEVGRANPRSLYPATLMHYIVCSMVLFLAEKGSPIKNTMLLAENDQALKDHWVWRDTSDFVSGLMLDYTSFNEQHEQKHLAMMLDGIKEIYTHYGVLTSDLEWAIDWTIESLSRVELETGRNTYTFKNGLLSGWRMTSWANSILNIAYLQVIAQQVEVLFNESIVIMGNTGGDDVMLLSLSTYHSYLILRTGKLMGFEFKPIKQLTSLTYREFFRLFTTSYGTYGSLCRVVGSAASGQWSNSTVGTLIDPATKMSSIMDTIHKIARRANFALNATQLLQVCAFKKWARSGEVKLVAEVLHGTRSTGGCGVPRNDGSMYELSGMRKMKPDASRVEIIGIPFDASQQQIEKLQADASRYVEKKTMPDAGQLAKRQAQSVFHAALAQSDGPGVAQLAVPVDAEYYEQQPTVVSVLTTGYNADTAKEFATPYAMKRMTITRYRNAYNRYSTYKNIVGEANIPTLLQAVAAETNTNAQLIKARDENTMYGLARVALTEDYYDAVFWLALLHSTDEREMNEEAARYASYLVAAGEVSY